MLDTFVALLLAHAAADFLFQTSRMVASKRQPGTLFIHGSIVMITAMITLGQVDAWPLVALAVVHVAIDIVKAYALPPRLWAYLGDQAAHLISIWAIAFLFPDLFALGLWAETIWMPGLMGLVAAFILVTVAGGHAVALLVGPWASETEMPQGLRNGGRLIGFLERATIFMLIVAGQPLGIGFLITAKSVLRFDTTSKDQRAGEYVIVGTLASFGWAMAVTWTVLLLVNALPSLGIDVARP